MLLLVLVMVMMMMMMMMMVMMHACLAFCLPRTACEESGQQPCPANALQQPLSEAQRVAVYRLSQLLYRQLPDKLAIANKEVCC
jgi:hypothetical protein